METKTETPKERPSLLLLNDDCLLELYDFLDIDGTINLAKTCRRLRFVADRTFKKHSTFRVNMQMIDKGEEYIDKLFQHIGQHVTCLDFGCEHRNLSQIRKIFGNVSNKCGNLKNLKISIVEPFRRGYVQRVFDNVEQLPIFITKTRAESLIKQKDLKTIFRNNRSIESLVMAGKYFVFDCRLLELIPNVESLCLLGSCRELDSLLNLSRLTKLQLDCQWKKINNFLKELATKGLIEEMHLSEVVVDDDIFEKLTSFIKLRLLVLKRSYLSEQLKSSIAWPAQLKKLRLCDFEWTQTDLIEMIRQLKSIESIDIGECEITENDITTTSLNYVTKLSRDIDHIIDHSNRKHRLNVVLPSNVRPSDPSKKYFVESERLRILHHQDDYDPLGIKIHIDGFDCWEV